MNQLFEVPRSSGETVTALRAALEREVEEAKKEAAWHHRVIFMEEVEAAFEQLATDGDEYVARFAVCEACERDEPDGTRACADLLERVETIAAAWLRLARAERGNQHLKSHES